MAANMKKPGAGGRRVSVATAGYRALYGEVNSNRIPANWRDRLPDATSYYAQHVTQLSKSNAKGWAQGVCPFHHDRNASLSVYIADPRGGWHCFAGCGSGDLLGFHMRRTGLGFHEAVADLLRGSA